MKINQISVFLENKPGHLNHACKALAQAGISLVTLSLADTEQFGILRLIVKEWEQAADILRAAGFVIKVNTVIATEVEDTPGGLVKVLDTIEESGLNIEYMYAFTFRRGGRAVLLFRFDNPENAADLLQKKGVNVLSNVELFSGRGE